MTTAAPRQDRPARLRARAVPPVEDRQPRLHLLPRLRAGLPARQRRDRLQRVPGEELADDRRRSAIGRLSRRPDLAALALRVHVRGAAQCLRDDAPVYATEQWIANAIGASSERPVLALVFASALILLPLGLAAGAAAVTRRLAGTGS